MRPSADWRFWSAGLVLLAAGIACSAPAGEATTAAPPSVAAPTQTPYVVTATSAPAGAPTTAAPVPTTAAPPPTTGPTAAPASRTVHAGMAALVFTPYSVVVPSAWADNHTSDTSAPNDNLTLSQGAYSMVISQAAGGAGPCVFGGAPVEMAQVFPAGVGITGAASQFMRGTPDGGLTWTVCEMKSGSYGFPTTFGYITYTVPASADPTLLAQMDGMVASLSH